MKKTLIALTVAASAAVSGSVWAATWSSGGSGGSVNIGGVLTPTDTTPWEVWVGDEVQNINSNIIKGDNSVTVNTPNAIPVLGIRTSSNIAFYGRSGISPQINYGGYVDMDNFSSGLTTLTLTIIDKGNQTQIGSLSVPFSAAAVSSWKNIAGGTQGYRALYAANVGDGFFGGLAKNADQAATSNAAVTLIASLNSDFAANFDKQGMSDIASYVQTETFSNPSLTYSAYYGAGIQANAPMKISLTNVATSDPITWQASLPIIVSYQ
ncbi:hypothetical protein HEL89_025470 [Escherichia coli]|nr:hypothetical protein [Escherichia coli]MBB7763880.1 hypothetical protein [Escherichia coli]